MKEELDSMDKNHVEDLVPLPEGVKPIGCKWIFRTKRDFKEKRGMYKLGLWVRHPERHLSSLYEVLF